MQKTPFKKLKIEKTPSPKVKSIFSKFNLTKQNIKYSLAGILVGMFLFMIGSSAFNLGKTVVKKINIPSIFPGFNFKTDSQNHTNVLLLGVGGEGHSGGNLTDTIILGSLDHNDKYTSLLSLPRDLFVKSEFGNTRINNIYEFAFEKYNDEQKAMDIFVKTVENITGVPIHYYVKINFKGFVEAVDTIDGIDVKLSEPFIDTAYPKAGTFDYETFYLPAGKNHLDGKTALKYARSRHSTSDFSRSERQHQILSLFKEKALKLGIITNPIKLKELFDSFSKNINTNLDWDEIIALAKIANEFSSEKMLSQTIHNNPVDKGGFLYTPEKRFFGNAFVFLPNLSDYYNIAKYDEIQKFIKLFFYSPNFFQKQYKFEILNGTKKTNFAYSVKTYLTRYGFNVIDFGNAKDRQNLTTKIYIKNKDITDEALKIIQEFVLGTIVKDIPEAYLENKSDVIIELGEDYIKYKDANKEKFY